MGNPLKPVDFAQQHHREAARKQQEVIHPPTKEQQAVEVLRSVIPTIDHSAGETALAAVETATAEVCGYISGLMNEMTNTQTFVLQSAARVREEIKAHIEVGKSCKSACSILEEHLKKLRADRALPLPS